MTASQHGSLLHPVNTPLDLLQPLTLLLGTLDEQMDTQPDAVHISLLGSVNVRVGAQQQLLRGRQQRISIARLALADGRPVPVSSLVEDLWSEKRPKDAVHALQAHMHRLRTFLNLDIEYVNDGYRLRDDSVSVDTKQFADLHEQGRAHLTAGESRQAAAILDTALRLWRGPALTDIDDVIGVRPFALQLSSMRQAAGDDRIEALLQCGEGQSLINELRASLAMDPLQETAWHQLMRALWRSGQEAEALAAFGQAREAFIEALGSEPGSRLTQLHSQILNNATDTEALNAVAHRPASPQTVSTSDTSLLVGRQDELAVLEQAWARSHNGLQIVTLSGEPGIGKTRLSEELTHRLASPDLIELRGRCDRSVPFAYQPFTEMLRDYAESLLKSEHLNAREPLVPELMRLMQRSTHGVDNPGGDANSGHQDIDSHRVMGALATWLSALSQHAPLLIRIDDVHWADEQTLLTLQHFLHTPRQINALIVLCMRDSRQLLQEGSRLSRFIRQSERVTHLPLARLTDDETVRLISAESQRLAKDDATPSWADEYVLHASGGNPLFVVELIRQLVIHNASTQDEIPAPPASISAVIQGRITDLPGTTQKLMRCAAVLGAQFELTFVAQLCKTSTSDAGLAVQAALEARLVAAAEEPLQYFFSHDIVRTVLYESLPAAERAKLHGQVVTILDGEIDELKKHQLLAHHYRNSDLPNAVPQAARHLFYAGQASLSRGAPADAGQLLTEARDLVHDEQDNPLRCDILTALGSAQLRLAQPEYRNTLLEASELAITLDDADRLTRAVLANNRGWWASTATLDLERIAHIEIALARCRDDAPAVRAQLQMTWALENVRDAGAREAVLKASENALALAKDGGDDRALASVLAHRYSVLYALFESPTECVHLNERLLTLANQQGDPQMRLSAVVGLTQSSMRIGDFATADRYLTESTQLAETLDDPSRLWLVRGWHAMRAIQRKQYQAAEELIFETFELGKRTGQSDAFTWFAGQLYTLRMLQGRLAEVVHQVRDQVATMADGIPSWKAAMALALSTTGYDDEAGSILDEFAANDFAQIPRDMLWLNGMCYLTMACEALGREDIAASLYRLLLPHSGMVASNGTVGAGPVDLHLGILARLQQQEEIASKHFLAAEGMSRRIDAPAWLELIHQRQDSHGSSASPLP